MDEPGPAFLADITITRFTWHIGLLLRLLMAERDLASALLSAQSCPSPGRPWAGFYDILERMLFLDVNASF